MSAQDRPNVVLILADDLGYGDLSIFNPESKIATPNIDSLGRHGIIFTDAHATASISTPSRYSIVTGRYTFRTDLKQGALDGYSAPLIGRDTRTIADMFSDSGYDTACIGKWHLGLSWTFRPGSDREIDYSCRIADGINERGFGYSFCLPASLDMPPYVLVEDGIVVSCPDRIEPGRTGTQLFREGPIAAGMTPEMFLPAFADRAEKFIRSRKGTDIPFFLYLPLTSPHTPILPSDEYAGSSGLDDYGDFVRMTDGIVGSITAALEESGFADNTIVVFTSDNGPAWYNNFEEQLKSGHSSTSIYRGRKFDLYEGGHRMPLVVSWGDRFMNRRYDGLISLSDFYATFAEMLDVTMSGSEAEDSYSFYPVISGKEGVSERESMVYQSGNGTLALRYGNWKLIFSPTSGGQSFPSLPEDREYIQKQPPVQLYNLYKDPREKDNVAEKNPETVRQMTELMKDIIVSGRSTPGIPLEKNYKGPWKQVRYIMNNQNDLL